MSPPTHKPLPSLIQQIPQDGGFESGEPCPGQAGTRGRFIGEAVPGLEAQRAPSSLRGPLSPGASASLPRVCRRKTPLGNTEIPTSRGRKEQGNGVGELHQLCAVPFAERCFLNGITRGSLLPCTAAGQTLRSCKSGGGCSVLMENTVTTRPLPHLD